MTQNTTLKMSIKDVFNQDNPLVDDNEMGQIAELLGTSPDEPVAVAASTEEDISDVLAAIDDAPVEKRLSLRYGEVLVHEFGGERVISEPGNGQLNTYLASKDIFRNGRSKA